MTTKHRDAGASLTHTNNFDAIRIAAALAVLVSHHHALTGQFEPLVLGIHTLGGFAVTASWHNDPHLLRFTLRRALRIWPAFIAVITLTAFGLGPWVTSLSLDEYLRHADTRGYSPPVLPRLGLISHHLLQEASLSDITTHGISANPFQDGGGATSSGQFSIEWTSDFPTLGYTTLIRLGVSKLNGTCDKAEVTSINQKGEARTARIRLQEWAGESDFAWGLVHAAAHGPVKGLRLDFECAPHTSVRFSSLGLYESSLGREAKNGARQIEK